MQNMKNSEVSDMLRLFATADVNRMHLPKFVAKNLKRILHIQSSAADLQCPSLLPWSTLTGK